MTNTFVDLRAGDRLRALPGKDLQVQGKNYFKEGDLGTVANFVTINGEERMNIVWERTGLTSFIPKAVWAKSFSFEAKAIELQAGDRVRALPGQQFTDKQFVGHYQEGDLGTVRRLECEKVSVVWERTGLSTTHPKALWFTTLRFEAKAIDLQVGDRVRALPGQHFEANSTNYFLGGDLGIVKSLAANADGEKVNVVWRRTGCTTNHPKESWFVALRFVGKSNAVPVASQSYCSSNRGSCVRGANGDISMGDRVMVEDEQGTWHLGTATKVEIERLHIFPFSLIFREKINFVDITFDDGTYKIVVSHRVHLCFDQVNVSLPKRTGYASWLTHGEKPLSKPPCKPLGTFDGAAFGVMLVER